MEAHGGYTFCGMAALVILKQEHLLNLRSLLVSDLSPGYWGPHPARDLWSHTGSHHPTALGDRAADAL